MKQDDENAINNNSDPLFTQYADMDFADAKPVSEVPALAKLQAAQGARQTPSHYTRS
jgi:hypothetical protein